MIRTYVSVREEKTDYFNGNEIRLSVDTMKVQTHDEEELGRLRKAQLEAICKDVNRCKDVLEDCLEALSEYGEMVSKMVQSIDDRRCEKA